MRKRFKGKGRVGTQANLSGAIKGRRSVKEQAKKQAKRRDVFHTQWQHLYDQCLDSGSRTRLLALREQFDRQKRGVSEPAQVETEVALFMQEAGFSVAFLEESQTRTADLECYLDNDRLFVEITAIVPSPSPRRDSWMAVSRENDEARFQDDLHQDILVRRLIARMAEKSRQLNRYCAPVLLAITVPTIEWLGEEKYGQEHVDLQRLAGLLSSALVTIPQLSAVLLTCWNLSAKPARSNIRLHNATWVARSEAETVLPRLRLLVTNTSGAYRLGEKEVLALKTVL
ncbi:MAG: hypothetical protein NPIRA05_13810 [Nitrospirales bacterium]|nr:MAG: hypothetical protein NPIRA05_13810 [Nitrospirales bacterium]